MSYRVGQRLLEYITVLDHTSTPLSGLSFEVPLALDPTGADIAEEIEIEDLGNGAYAISYDTSLVSPVGRYYVQLVAPTTPPQHYEIEWQLRGRDAEPYPGATGGTTLRQLRRSVFNELGGIVVLSATRQTPGDRFTDVDNLTNQAGSYAGRQVYATVGNEHNVGQFRTVTQSNREATLQFSRSFPQPFSVGDEVEMVNPRGLGVTIEEVHAAINDALRTAGPTVRATHEATADSEEIPIPDDWVAIDSAQYADPRSGWRDLRKAARPGKAGWAVDRARRTIVISQHFGRKTHGLPLRFTGYVQAAPLREEDDVTDVDFEWLVTEAASSILLRSMGGSRSVLPEWERKGNLLLQVADQKRAQVAPRRSANYTVL